MKGRTEPLQYLWWLVSRASGILALVLISLSVIMGLAMAAKAISRPGLKRTVMRLHEHIALVALIAIAVHGLALFGDTWLKPGWREITVPFALSYRPAFTGLGIIGGYLALLLGPSFYLRKRIGVRRWRKLHRATLAVWVLGVVHTLGSGSDGGELWLRVVVLAPVIPIVYLAVLRLSSPSPARTQSAQPHQRSPRPSASNAGRAPAAPSPRADRRPRAVPPSHAGRPSQASARI